VYLIGCFIVSAIGTSEAILSLEVSAKAKADLQSVAEKGFIFPTPDDKLPTIDLIIVAYLPNEQDIILGQIKYALEKIIYPREKIWINVVYNTPYTLQPLETQLEDLCSVYTNCRIIKVPHSTSKAENVNHFLDLGANGSLGTVADVTAIYDCDHFPHPYAPRWAAERFIAKTEIDIVQGRCIVYNVRESFVTRIVAVEFDRIYSVGHPGRQQMFGFGLFCGSNGYWKTKLLSEIRMDPDMLTEDIDSAMRAFETGATAVHDMNVISYEQAPTTIPALWKQRLRWAQGWTQVSLKKTGLIWKKVDEGAINAKRSLSQRIGLIMLLPIRESTYYLNTQYLNLMIGFVITRFPRNGIGLVSLIFFEYPVSQWLFIARLVLSMCSAVSNCE
jgi:cellulose synthase/poly-beta-1,6-N-acetylglucosamine synthase-like glycosyltransferase